MSSANLDLVRSLYADWERGDFFANADWAHAEIECVMVDGPTPGRGTGLTGMANVWRDVISAYEDFRVTAEEYLELDEQRVLVLVRFSGRGKTSGLELGQMHTRNASLLELDGNKVRRLVLYWDRDRAFADLGLAPDPGA